MKKIGLLFVFVIFTIIIIPVGITLLYGIEQPKSTVTIAEEQKIRVIEPNTQEVKTMGFEEYIRGVVAAEMPALFEEEALKAQAVAARTYALRRIRANQKNNDPKEADMSMDYRTGQAYLSIDQLKQRWGDHFYQYYDKITKAVDATTGEIMIYNQEPIEAVFHSTSAGITQNAEDVWSVEVPYLKSVESKLDEHAPDFISTKTIAESDAMSVLKNQYPELLLSDAKLLTQIQIIDRTEGGYIKTAQIGNKIVTGRELRELFKLRSSNFTIQQAGDSIVFTTQGYGHGAGMSQYGANFMAQQGKTYREILFHYYQGVEVITMQDEDIKKTDF